MKLFNISPFVALVAIVLFFFNSFIISQQLPIPSDTIIGLYHPFRDLYSKDYPNGIPFKNFLVTDPVRQQYPWRELAVSIEKKLELPLWNPYSFSGTPLLANIQTSAFYPLNFLFFLFPFYISWSILIVFEPLLGGLFLYCYLNNLKLNKWASLIGAIAFSFSGFSIAWMEWGTITHVGLWLPLILLSIDKIFFHFHKNSKFNTSTSLRARIQNSKLQFKIKNYFWPIIFIFSLISAFFAGHLQTFFYLFLVSVAYFFARWIQHGKKFETIALFIILNSLFIILAVVQWLPTIQFILESARSVDIPHWQKEGWFIPWQHLIQFIAPDFFGNTSTLNYWGAWNYGEFIGYVGIFPLLMAVFALFFRHDKKTLLFGTLFFISLLFSLPTILAKLPYILSVPFLSTSQPTRLLFIVDFSLAVLAAFGLDYFIRIKKREILHPLIFFSLIIATLWAFVLFGNNIVKLISLENLSVAKNNLIFPSLIFFVSAILIILFTMFYKTKIFTLILCCIIVVTMFDLLRFGFKFTSFTKKEYLFPQTKTLEFLQKNLGNARIMATDSRILPPNFSTIYRLQTVEGYDPLYLQRYGELIAASERDKPDITPPFGFNRIITPHNYQSKIMDLLGVKYILSLSDLKSEKLKKVFQEGQTRVYENKRAIARAFFVQDIEFTKNKKETIEIMFKRDVNLQEAAVVEVVENSRGVLSDPPLRWTKGEADIIAYSENKIVVNTKNEGEGFLVLTDSFYPSWRAKIDNMPTAIYRTDYNFRGIIVPKGNHTVIFYNTLL